MFATHEGTLKGLGLTSKCIVGPLSDSMGDALSKGEVHVVFGTPDVLGPGAAAVLHCTPDVTW